MKTAQIPDNWTIEQVGRRLYVYNERGEARCGAVKRDGTACHDWPMKGKARCRRHGGKVASGKASGAYKDGKHIMRYDMPERLSQHFEKLANDPKLLDLRDNILILDIRLQELMAKFDTADFGEAVLPKLSKLSYRAEKALRNKDMEAFVDLWNQMTELIRRGQGDYLTWQDILQTNDERRKMTKTVVDIELSAHRAISLNELMYLFDKLYHIFQDSNNLENAKDRENSYVEGVRYLLNEGKPK